MCLIICGNVSSLFFPRSREKEVAAANRVHNARFRPGFSTNAGLDANRFATCLLRLKSTVHEHFQCWNKDSVMAEIFHILLAEYEKKVSIDAQWQLWMAPCCKPDTLSKISG